MIEKAYAKINLTLEVIGKKGDYHQLESVVVPIDIYDELKFEKSNVDEVVSNVYIENNNIYDAIDLFKKTYNIKEHVKVTLTKNIPIGYGLGGSSADISGTIRGLNKFFNINKPLTELEDIANALGSDTLFCLYNKRAFIYGRGDKIKFLDKGEKLSFLIIYPKTHLLTKDVFKKYSQILESPRIGFDNKDIDFILKYKINDLFTPALILSEELNNVYNKFKKVDIKLNMTGSGTALFIVNPNEKDVLKVKEILNDEKMQITKEI